jgi:hypothetical protein
MRLFGEPSFLREATFASPLSACLSSVVGSVILLILRFLSLLVVNKKGPYSRVWNRGQELMLLFCVGLACDYEERVILLESLLAA